MKPDTSCWERYGVRGDATCARLREVGHCRHCEVLIAAARARLSRPFSSIEQEEWTRAVAQEAAPAPRQRELWLVLRVSGQHFALPAMQVAAVLEYSQPHRLPHQGQRPLLGALGWMGRLLPCVCLAGAMNLPTTCQPAHTAILKVEDEHWALAVDAVLGMHEVYEGDPDDTLDWHGHTAQMLNAGQLVQLLREAVR